MSSIKIKSSSLSSPFCTRLKRLWILQVRLQVSLPEQRHHRHCTCDQMMTSPEAIDLAGASQPPLGLHACCLSTFDIGVQITAQWSVITFLEYAVVATFNESMRRAGCNVSLDFVYEKDRTSIPVRRQWALLLPWERFVQGRSLRYTPSPWQSLPTSFSGRLVTIHLRTSAGLPLQPRIHPCLLTF